MHWMCDLYWGGAKNLHYGLDFCPAFWQWLIDSHADGRVLIIDKPAARADELTQWVHDHGNDLFRETDTAVAGQQCEPAAINTFCRWRSH